MKFIVSAISLTLALFTTSTTASAAGKGFYTCYEVGGTDEWTVHVDLQKKEAGFFDNNVWSVIPLVSHMVLESNPPQDEYTFFGTDIGNAGKPMKIIFNKTRMKASVILDIGTLDEAVYEAEGGCEKVKEREM